MDNLIKSTENENLHGIWACWCLEYSECDTADQAWVSSGTGNALRCLEMSAWSWHWAEGYLIHLGLGLSRPPEHCTLIEEYLIDELSFCAVPD